MASAPGDILDELFPAGVATWLGREPAAAGPLLPAELAGTERFVASRLAEFRHGRDCARRALARLGVASVAVPIGPRREPLWPAGLVGSISHAGPVAAAAVARAAQFRGLGLDLEPEGALEPALVARICRPAELAGCADAAAAGRHARRVFTLKEAAYKALWPAVGAFFDFHELEVVLDAAGGTWRAVSRCAQVPPALAAALAGRCAVRDGLLVAAAVLPAAAGVSPAGPAG